jgi:type II secretory pathway component GspD/PulD (secretin)
MTKRWTLLAVAIAAAAMLECIGLPMLGCAPQASAQVLAHVRVVPSEGGADIVIWGTAALPDPVVTATDDGWLVAEFPGTSAYPWAGIAAGRGGIVTDLSVEQGDVGAAGVVGGCALVARLTGAVRCETVRMPGGGTIVLRLAPRGELAAGMREEAYSDTETLADVLGESEGPTPAAEQQVEPEPAASEPGRVSPDADGRYSLNMAEEDVGVALKALARQSRTNIAVASGVSGKVTLELHDVTVEDALRYITELTELAWRKDGNTYVVTKAPPAAEVEPGPPPPPAVIATYTTSNVGATQLAQTVGDLFREDGLVAKAGPPQVTPTLDEAQTSEVTGVASASLTTGASTEIAVDRARIVILRGPEPVVHQAMEACRRLDTPRQQVKIEVLVMDISTDALRNLGLTWTWSSIGFREERTSEGIKFGEFGRDTVSIDATLSALARDDAARLLARPVVSVVDGGRAFVLIGERILYPVLVGYTQAQTPIFDKGEERVGIYMQVAPRVSEDGEITMTIYPQVSVVTDYMEVNGASYPQISTREAQTTVRVRSGDQIVIGGLIQDDDIRTLRRVPGLSKIPLFGELFKWRSTTTRRSEVVIFMRPILVLEAEDTHPSPLGGESEKGEKSVKGEESAP